MLRPTTDGVVTIRPPVPGDAERLVAGRDDEFDRFLGPGSPDPDPLGCIEVAGEVVGWVDHDTDRFWLEPGEVNIGYHLFAPQRGRGLATRAVELLVHHLAVDTDATCATLLIHPDNHRSLGLARRIGAVRRPDLDGIPYFGLAVPPKEYGDGVVTIRRLQPDDLGQDLAAKDDEQQRWLWRPGEPDTWAAMSAAQRETHALAGLQARHDSFATGPQWCFAVDAGVHRYVAHVECDLRNELVPAGEANISYAAHPAYRGRGFVSRAVRLALAFLADHTAAQQAHLVVDVENEPSRRVAAAVGATEVESWTDARGRTMARHVVAVPRP